MAKEGIYKWFIVFRLKIFSPVQSIYCRSHAVWKQLPKRGAININNQGKGLSVIFQVPWKRNAFWWSYWRHFFSPPDYVLETAVVFFKIRGTEEINGLIKEAQRTYWLSGGKCLLLIFTRSVPRKLEQLVFYTSLTLLTWPLLFHIGAIPSCRLNSLSRAELTVKSAQRLSLFWWPCWQDR